MCLQEDLDQKSSPRSNWAVWEYTRKSCARVVPRPLGDVPVGAYDSTRLFAFDLLELDGRDLRREPLEVRKATLASVLRKAATGLQLNEHLAHQDGAVVFRHACKMELEGIVSK